MPLAPDAAALISALRSAALAAVAAPLLAVAAVLLLRLLVGLGGRS